MVEPRVLVTFRLPNGAEFGTGGDELIYHVFTRALSHNKLERHMASDDTGERDSTRQTGQPVQSNKDGVFYQNNARHTYVHTYDLKTFA